MDEPVTENTTNDSFENTEDVVESNTVSDNDVDDNAGRDNRDSSDSVTGLSSSDSASSSDNSDIDSSASASNDKNGLGSGANAAPGVASGNGTPNNGGALPQSGSAMDTQSIFGFGVLLVVAGLFTIKKKVTR